MDDTKDLQQVGIILSKEVYIAIKCHCITSSTTLKELLPELVMTGIKNTPGMETIMNDYKS